MSTEFATARTRGYGLALIGTALPGALLGCLFIMTVSVVPASKTKFDAIGMPLSWFTQTVIRVSSWVSDHWATMAPFVVVAGVANFVLIRWLGARSARPPILWITISSLVLFVLVAVTLASVEIPMSKLRQGMAR